MQIDLASKNVKARRKKRSYYETDFIVLQTRQF